jgi:hypothetical protein
MGPLWYCRTDRRGLVGTGLIVQSDTSTSNVDAPRSFIVTSLGPPPGGPFVVLGGFSLFTTPQHDRLSKPIAPERVKSRSQSGQSLSYIEAHDAIRTANEIFGIGGWGYTVEELVHLGNEPVEKNGRKGFKTGYRAVVKVTIHGSQPAINAAPTLPGRPTITYSDVGFGDAVDYSGSTISVQELAMKEAVSDGVKRALKNLGDQFGLGLYDAERRGDVERRRGLTTDAGIKREVWKIAREKTGKDKPSAAEVAKAFGRKAAELNEPAVLRQILADEGVL